MVGWWSAAAPRRRRPAPVSGSQSSPMLPHTSTCRPAGTSPATAYVLLLQLCMALADCSSHEPLTSCQLGHTGRCRGAARKGHFRVRHFGGVVFSPLFPHLQWSPAAVDSAAAGGSLRPTSSSALSNDRCVIGRSNLFPPPCSCAGSCACAAMYSPPSGRPLRVHVWDELTHVHCEALLVRSRASSWRCKACCHVWAARRSQRQVLAEHSAAAGAQCACLRRAVCVPKRCSEGAPEGFDRSLRHSKCVACTQFFQENGYFWRVLSSP